MNKSLIILGLIIVSATVMYYLSGLPQPVITICTKDAYICPDGSTLRRVPPRCNFPACPKAVKEEPTATPSASITPDYQCPENGWVNCMPILTEKAKKACSKDALNWYKNNCPTFKGAAY